MTTGLPVGRRVYDVIYCDPPWAYRSMYRKTANERVQSTHPEYAQMTFRELAELPIQDLASPRGCVMLMWATGPHVETAVRLMKAWGFSYATVFLYWRKVSKAGKPRVGLGNYTRSSAEFLLIGRRGSNISRLLGNRNVPQELEDTVRKHSQKPVKTYDVLNAFFPRDAAKIELFARVDPEAGDRLKGWDQWGNEIPPDGFRQIPS